MVGPQSEKDRHSSPLDTLLRIDIKSLPGLDIPSLSRPLPKTLRHHENQHSPCCTTVVQLPPLPATDAATTLHGDLHHPSSPTPSHRISGPRETGFLT